MKQTTMKAAANILGNWAVQPTAERDWPMEIGQRIRFLQRTLLAAGRECLVLGISGGVDSMVAGKLCQLAIDGLKADHPQAAFIAVRLPYGVQADEQDAQAAMTFIDPDRIETVDIRPSVDALHIGVVQGRTMDEARLDFERGNVKARIRMTVQYEIAALNNALVVGTDHNAEAVTGFFTKWGDGACDLMPLRGLNKRQVRRLAIALGADQSLADKAATADLEDLRPQRSDEDALGLPYSVIDDFLEGLPVSETQLAMIISQYEKTQHKRIDPPAAMGPYPLDVLKTAV